MMGSKLKKQFQLGQNPDIISNLQDNILEQILVRVPIRDVIRTSVLSSKWRYKWYSIPELCFSDNCIPPSSRDKKSELINFIDHVLSVHTGQIQKFQLSSSYLNICSSVDYWILVLSRKSIKELVVRLSGEEDYHAVLSIFLCQDLRILELDDCKVKPSLSFDGFSKLKWLHLCNVDIDNEFLNRLISNCPLLESLKLTDLIGADYLNICAPKLISFDLSTYFEDICFEYAPLLSVVSICRACDDDMHVTPSKTSHLINVIDSNLSGIRELAVVGAAVEFFGAGVIPEKLSSTFNCLQKLCLTVNFELLNSIYVIMCLFNSFPNLQQLDIWAKTYRYASLDEKNYVEYPWVSQTQMESNMKHIRRVKVGGLSGYQSELNFIKYVLAKSPMLEMLSVMASYPPLLQLEHTELLKALIKFPRASVKAEIVYSEFMDDSTF